MVDEQGEVLARSNVVLEGYWQQPEATAEALQGGWFHTGDGGSIDADGYLAISDRKKDVIISGGENVSSIEVEDALCSHPAVAEAAVIGVPHEKWGETVKALVVLAAGQKATEQDLIAHCRTQLTHYKCPTSVEIRSELLRTATGKLRSSSPRACTGKGARTGELTAMADRPGPPGDCSSLAAAGRARRSALPVSARPFARRHPLIVLETVGGAPAGRTPSSSTSSA